MSDWDAFPADYRAAEVAVIEAATRAGECVAVVGLSGAGKSNLLGYLAARQASGDGPRRVLVDGNRLGERTADAFWSLIQRALEPAPPGPTSGDLDAAVDACLAQGKLCFLLDLSVLLGRQGKLLDGRGEPVWGRLRALRDRHKYALTYVVATRHALRRDNELAELFFGHTLYLGPLSAADADWNIRRYAARTIRDWSDTEVQKIRGLSGGYPALLRGVCEAYAGGCRLEAQALAQHPAVAERVAEFWADDPDEAELSAAGVTGNALLTAGRPARLDTTRLTAKEFRLLAAFEARLGAVCEKDDLIRAVWPEDQVYENGIRDDSLAQLVRRLREKVEADAARPQLIQTVPGRGYRLVKRISGSA
jgi:hypothetical protein